MPEAAQELIATERVAPFEPQMFNQDVIDRAWLNEMLIYAIDNDVSDIKIVPYHPVMAAVGKQQYPLTNRDITPPKIKELINHLYNNDAGDGIVASGTPLNSAYDVKVPKNRMAAGSKIGRWRYRFNATACHSPGEQASWIAIRTIAAIPRTLRELNIEETIISNLRPEKGMILIGGITGSGKTTLLAAIIRHLISGVTGRSETIVTNESPIEYVFDQVEKGLGSLIIQQELGRDIKPGPYDPEFGNSPWAQAIANGMRQKPTILINGESRDPYCFRAGVTAAATGHLYYTTVHTSNVALTIFRIINEFPLTQQSSIAIGLLSNLHMIVCQDLVEKKDGKLIAIREFLVFTQDLKSELLEMPIERWMPHIQKYMDTVPPNIGRRAITHLREHYAAGLIDDHVMQRWEVEGRLKHG